MIGDLPEELRRADCGNLSILPAMQLDDLAKQLASCHLGLCLLRELPAMKKAFPAKAYDFLGAGLPMLVGPEGELADAVERMGCGVSFTKVSPQEVAQSIVWTAASRFVSRATSIFHSLLTTFSTTQGGRIS